MPSERPLSGNHPIPLEARLASPLLQVNPAMTVTIQAVSGLTIPFHRSNDPGAPEVPMPHLVLYENGGLTTPISRTLLVTVSNVEVPLAGVTVTLKVDTQHGDPDLLRSSGITVPIQVWDESRWISNTWVLPHRDADNSATPQRTSKQHPTQKNGIPDQTLGTRKAQTPHFAPRLRPYPFVFAPVTHFSLGRCHLLSPGWHSKEQKLAHRPHVIRNTSRHSWCPRHPLLGRTIPLGRYRLRQCLPKGQVR